MSSEESQSKCRIWTSWSRSLYNWFLDDTILEVSSSRVSLSKFWCKHMPPNFGIKMILFQNFYLFVPRVATAHSEVYAWLLISRAEFYIIPQQYHFQLAQSAYFSLLSWASFNILIRHHQSLNPSRSSALPSCCSATFLQPFSDSDPFRLQ